MAKFPVICLVKIELLLLAGLCGSCRMKPSPGVLDVLLGESAVERVYSRLIYMGDCTFIYYLETNKWPKGTFGMHWRNPGNGGWDRWNFLSASRPGIKGNLWPGKGEPLIDVLASGQRAMVDVAWPLNKINEQTNDLAYKEIVLRLIRYPGATFIYCELFWTDPTAGPTQVVLHGYPCSTYGGIYFGGHVLDLGAKRWIRGISTQTALTGGVTEIGDRDGAYLLFNRQANEEAGMKLVFLTNEVAQATSQGAFHVALNLKLATNACRLRFALGEYTGMTAEKAADEFFQKEVQQVKKRLKSADWDLRPSSDDQWQRDVQELLSCPANAIVAAPRLFLSGCSVKNLDTSLAT